MCSASAVGTAAVGCSLLCPAGELHGLRMSMGRLGRRSMWAVGMWAEHVGGGHAGGGHGLRMSMGCG